MRATVCGAVAVGLEWEVIAVSHHEHLAEPRCQRQERGAESWSDAQLMLTAEEAARTLKVGRTTLYGLIRDGQLRAVHIGRSCRLTRAELIRYVEQLDHPAPDPNSAAARFARPVDAARHARARTVFRQDRLFDLEPPPDAA